jgi:peptidoglycan/xylan/chitin deacetylase (PgdA/CDA1 family)
LKPLLLTFDVEEFDLPLELGRGLDIETQIKVTLRGLRRILPVLRRHAVPATFFVTGEVARRRPETLAELLGDGHEVAVHGLLHGDDYATMAAEQAVDRLRRARGLIETAIGAPALGLRTPRLRPCPAAIVRRAGFVYDASPHPTWVPGRYNGLRLPRSPWMDDGVLCLPISVLPAVRLPVSWLFCRAAGPRLGTALAHLAARGMPYLHLYFHPWEAVPLRPFGVPPWLRLRTGDAFLDLLATLLASATESFEPMTLSAYAERSAGPSPCPSVRA